jgi:ribonuclease P protein component
VNRRFRLTKSADFKRVRHLGKSFAHPLVVLIAHPNELESSRIGIAAGRTLGGAVQRNRAKRILRAAIRPLITQIPPGWDILLIARLPLLEVKSHEVQKSLVVLLNRAHLLQESHEL